jgi:galactonate dehydratase
MSAGEISVDIAAIEASTVEVSAKTTWIFLRIRLNDGTEGYGEATRFGAEEGVLAEIALARSMLVGKALAIPGGALAALRMAHASDARNAVTHGIEQALADAMARRAGLPLGRMLGGDYRSSVMAYANINRGTLDRSPAGFAARAGSIVADHGYGAVKIAPFDGLDWRRTDAGEGRRLLKAGIERILATRDAIGSGTLLMVDCHWRLSPLMAHEVLRATAAASLFWLEDALDESGFLDADLHGLRSAANAIGTRIAGGEKIGTLADMRDLLARGGADVVLPDLRVTGIRAGMAMLDLAAASGAEVSIHNPVGPVLDAVSLQVAAALPSFLILEGQVGESPRFDEIAGGRQPLADGRRPVTQMPGIGLSPKLTFTAGIAPPQRAASFAGMAGAGPDG